ncbi:DUF1697 domain-containing protein [Arsenicicoccus sp. MKL-02]|uniref:DUF1697 domain-containing protein n=1 Tax=Arsenicicoccus cauae TaxID=2663847 RepID=A0A6I3IX52_9MICO|nr:DUF1697 domain-containing protein [Arsenicicoccus cauae]MTB73039.1 DUF1697 domain-containing protein [Arsenicicoccus cauae]
MSTWIGFLRAINLAGKRTFSPQQIVACLEAAGFTDVATHINTGNVRLTTTTRSRDKVVAAMERAFLDDRGFEVPVALLTPAEVRAVADELDEVGEGHEGRHYVSFLPQEPSAEVVTALHALEAPGERVVPRGRAVHLLLGPDYHRSRLTNTAVERVAGMATNRNRTVVEAIAAKWC